MSRVHGDVGGGGRWLGIVTLVVARSIFAFLRLIGPDRSSALGGWIARTLGPMSKPHRIARENLAAAFPEKTEDERAAILRGAWDNLGRTSAEYPHLRKLMDFNYDDPDPDGRITVNGIPNFMALRDDGQPGLIFTGHLANWEISGVLAPLYDLDVTAIYRAPNDPGIRKVIEEIRSETMGGLEASRPGAAYAIRDKLEAGGHIAMLADQHFSRGRSVTFFGRPALANPMIAKFARLMDCPVVGVRAIRRGGARFTLEMTPPLDLPRDAKGRIDEQGAVEAITAVVEGWVREHPEQWLWMHRRWRAGRAGSKKGRAPRRAG